jgi:signal transduction histidine kinase
MEMEFNTQKWIVVQINDTGIGISDDNKEAIFSPEYTTKDGHDGEGLWLTKTYIDKLGGQITVDSIPGKGTKFTVLLPAC